MPKSLLILYKTLYTSIGGGRPGSSQREIGARKPLKSGKTGEVKLRVPVGLSNP